MLTSRMVSSVGRSLLKQARSMPRLSTHGLKTFAPCSTSLNSNFGLKSLSSFASWRALSSTPSRPAPDASASDSDADGGKTRIWPKKRSPYQWRNDLYTHYHGLNLEELFLEYVEQPVVYDTYTKGMTGSYVHLSEEELKLLPEGLAGQIAPDAKRFNPKWLKGADEDEKALLEVTRKGDADLEFQLNRDKQFRWMIRDSGKLLCQLLDRHMAQSKGRVGENVTNDNIEYGTVSTFGPAGGNDEDQEQGGSARDKDKFLSEFSDFSDSEFSSDLDQYGKTGGGKTARSRGGELGSGSDSEIAFNTDGELDWPSDKEVWGSDQEGHNSLDGPDPTREDNYKAYFAHGHPAETKYEKRNGEVTAHHQVFKFAFPGLTDRPEWVDALMKVEHHGRTLRELPENSLKAAGTRYTHAQMAAELDGENYYRLLMQKLEKDKAPVPNQILLAGVRGVGKSFTLNQTVLHARKNGWLCLFIPDGWSQSQLGSYVQPALVGPGATHSPIEFKLVEELKNEDELLEMDMPKRAAVNEHTVYDNHEMSAEVLRGFWRAHAAQLRTIPIRDASIMNKYLPYMEQFRAAYDRIKNIETEWEKQSFVQLRSAVMGQDAFSELDNNDQDVLKDFKYDNFQAKTLEDMILLGVALRDLAGSIFVDLMQELRALDDPRMPVLIAVDHYNVWEGKSAFSYNGKSIPTKQLCVPYALNFLGPKKETAESWSIKNGVCIAATSLRTTEGRQHTYDQHRPSMPLTIQVPHYSSTEFLCVSAFYSHMGLLSSDMVLTDILGLRTFSGSNPRLLRQQGIPYIMPRQWLYEGVRQHERMKEAARRSEEDYLRAPASVGAEPQGSASDPDEEEFALFPHLMGEDKRRKSRAKNDSDMDFSDMDSDLDSSGSDVPPAPKGKAAAGKPAATAVKKTPAAPLGFDTDADAGKKRK